MLKVFLIDEGNIDSIQAVEKIGCQNSSMKSNYYVLDYYIFLSGNVLVLELFKSH